MQFPIPFLTLLVWGAVILAALGALLLAVLLLVDRRGNQLW